MSEVHRWERDGLADPAASGVREGLTESELAPTPWQQASAWLADAQRAGALGQLAEPTTMAVATVDAQGLPDVRAVLMRFFTPAGPGFVTSARSVKAAHIAANPVLAAALTWPSLFRAIRFRGAAVTIDPAETGAYWRQRPWGSKISAWASRQSAPIGSRADLEAEVARLASTWPERDGQNEVPVPPDWIGYRIECDEVELWAGRRDRLHDRFRFTRVGPGDLDTPAAWSRVRLQP